jgi:hypothetical protein
MSPTATLAAQPALHTPPAPRADLYAPIHKALRSFMSDTLCRIGRIDVTDDDELHAGLGQLGDLLAACTSHLQHENHFVHTAIDARLPGGAHRTADDHLEHGQSIEALRAEADGLRTASVERRPALALRLYRHLALFVAENLQHMQFEETANNQALWQHYSDAELHAVHRALVASIPPAEMMQTLRWMLPALTPQERAGMLGEMQQGMPPEAFRTVLDMLRPQLAASAWRKLALALNLPARAQP